MKVLRAWLVVCLIVLSAGLVGCQAASDKIAEEAAEGIVKGATGVDVEADDDEVTITGEDGSTFTASDSGDLPEDFPSDVPVPDGDIVGSMVSQGNFTVTIESGKAVLDVYEWCLDEVKAEGWTVVTEFKSGDAGSIVAEKGADSVNYTITESDGESAILVFTGPKP